MPTLKTSTLKTFMRSWLSIAAVATVGLAVIAPACAASSSITPRPDGGQSRTVTRPAGSECSVFSKEGELKCTRTFSITNHSEAVTRCVALKC